MRSEPPRMSRLPDRKAELPPATLIAEVGALLLAQEWTFAKTMPENPHWYTVSHRWATRADFEKVVEFIYDYGYDAMFDDWPYRQFDVADHFYWVNGWAPTDTTIINRKPLRGTNPDAEPTSIFAPADLIAGPEAAKHQGSCPGEASPASPAGLLGLLNHSGFHAGSGLRQTRGTHGVLGDESCTGATRAARRSIVQQEIRDRVDRVFVTSRGGSG